MLPPTDELNARLEQAYRETEGQRFFKVRNREMDNPELVTRFPDRVERKGFLRQTFDRQIDEEIAEIKSRPGSFKDNLLTELYVRHAEASFVNDNVRERIPPSPPTPQPERER